MPHATGRAGNETPLVEIGRPAEMIGKTISHYRILKILGEGGMGVVYEAEDVRLGRHVALKFVVHKLLDRRETVERFEREARAASVLNHPNICTVHDVGEAEGHHYIAMELLEGTTLDLLLTSGPLPPRRLLGLAIQIAEGLDAAHSRGVVHRDIKPANIFVTSAGFVKIMDFGLAKILMSPAAESLIVSDSEVTHAKSLTVPGFALGTVSFMSPEQTRGEDVDARSDLFSFGTVLYDMSVGEPPFRGSTPAVILSGILERQPVPPMDRNPAIPPRLQDIILKALEKDREDRYQSARDMLVDLRRILRDIDSGSTASSIGFSSPGMSGARPAALAAGAAAEKEPPRARFRHPALVAAAAAVVVATLVFGFWKLGAGRPTSGAAGADPIRSLVVLPLENLSNDPAQDYFADGMTDELIAKLSNVSALRVISRTSAMHYKGLKKSLPEIARELQVDAVVEGSVLRSNDRVRINARLIQVPAERQLWADGYERDIRDVLALQSDVAGAIVREIRVKLSPGESSHLAAQSQVDPEAYQLYLQGRTSFSRFTPDSLTKAAEYFKLAIAKDPSYALAYAGLADSYIQLAGRLLPPRDVMPKAKTAIERALALNESLGEAHSSLAQVKLFYEFDWNGARAEYRRALEMSPASPLIHQMNGLLLASEGRAEDSLAEARRVLDSDPVSTSSGCLRARLLYYAHRYDQSIEQYRKTVASDPTATGSCTWAIFAFHKRGRVAEGIAAAKQAVDVSPNEMLPRAALARGYGISGNRQEAERVIRELEEISKRRFVSEYEFAAAYSGWNPEQSLAWLEKGYAGRVGMLVYLGVDSAFDELRPDPRFGDLLRRIGIPR